jgi:hypothetical protein
MTDKKNPAQRAAGRALGNDLTTLDAPENTSPQFDVQLLRAAYLMRRVPLSSKTARFIANLHFGEVAR